MGWLNDKRNHFWKQLQFVSKSKTFEKRISQPISAEMGWLDLTQISHSSQPTFAHVGLLAHGECCNRMYDGAWGWGACAAYVDAYKMNVAHHLTCQWQKMQHNIGCLCVPSVKWRQLWFTSLVLSRICVSNNSYRDVGSCVSSTCGARCNDACARCVTTSCFLLMHVHDGYCGAKTFEQFKVLSADLHVFCLSVRSPGYEQIILSLSNVVSIAWIRAIILPMFCSTIQHNR